jgi:hypothetical protein
MLTENDLDQFCGSENLYRRSTLTYTDGIRFLSNQAQCHWLIDAIVSHHPTVKQTPRLNEFGFWELTIAEDNSATLAFYGDSGEPPAIEQRIPFTDFANHCEINPLKLYQQNGTLFLPSEY